MRISLRFDLAGSIHCLHTEAIDLTGLGRLDVVRATDLYFDPASQQWQVRRAGDPDLLHQHPSRQACLDWERDNLQPGAWDLDPEPPHPIRLDP